METYDVILVGAGPAGGSCARELSKLGHSVLLIERSNKIGIPNFSTGGTPNETIKVFDLPKNVTDCPWNSLLIASRNERAEFLYGKTMGYILNYMLLKQYLAKQARKNGAEVITGANVDDAIINNGFISGVKFSKDGINREAFAKVIVDASGGRALLSQKLGLIKGNKNFLAVGVEYHMKNVKLERKGRMETYIGSSHIHGGYAWIFPSGATTAKVGLGLLIPVKPKPDMLSLLKKFAETNPQTEKAIQTDLHSGSLFANGGIKNHVLNGFIAIGDAAVQINPIAGEGIRHALYSGRFAAETIDSALEDGDTSSRNLQPYNEKWGRYVGNKWKVSYWLQKLMYGLRDDKIVDEFIKKLSEYDPQEIFEVAFNYRFDLMKKGLPSFMKIISSRAFRSLLS